MNLFCEYRGVYLDQKGLLDSECTCPYDWDCKHAVAVILEYLERIEAKKRVPKAKPDDERLAILAKGPKRLFHRPPARRWIRKYRRAFFKPGGDPFPIVSTGNQFRPVFALHREAVCQGKIETFIHAFFNVLHGHGTVGGDFFGKAERFRQQSVRFGDTVHQSDPKGFVCADAPAGEHQPLGLTNAHQPGQTLGAARTGQDAVPHLR